MGLIFLFAQFTDRYKLDIAIALYTYIKAQMQSKLIMGGKESLV